MLGRPLRIDPLFMKACAGSWLICSVIMDRMMAIRSAIVAMLGNRSEIIWPDWPWGWNSQNGPRAMRALFWSCASCWPFVNDSGNGWPCSSFSRGL